MCRWLERDPAGYQDGPSLYSYLGRNPMAGTDPYGLAGLYSVGGGSKTAEKIRYQLDEIDRNKAMARGINGSMCRHPLGSDAQFNDDMRFNSDRLEDVVKVGQGIGTAIETTASVLPGGGFATGVHEASQGNYGAAALSVIPGVKAVKVLRKGSKAAKAAKLPRYNGPKPKYAVNPMHAPGTLRRGKTPLPADAEAAYRRAVPDDPIDAEHWYGRGDDGTIYRFSNSNDGTVHFSGADGVGDGIRNITDYARRRLNGE
jgi:hypothetical protein